MRTEAELEQLKADIAAQDRERQDAGQLRAEIERLTAENERLKRSIDLCSGSCSYQQNASRQEE